MIAETRALELDNVARRFGRRWVLRGVTFRVSAGETVALMGRNGSGKTTLLRVIATLLRPTRGTGTVFGNTLIKDADEIRQLVGILGHHAGLYDDLTASENLQFATQMYGLDVAQADILRALDEVGLGSESTERVRAFSAGMRRRLAMARLSLRPPKLLLMDEPFAAFDEAGIELVNAFVRRIVDDGGAALIATHDSARAHSMGARVVRLQGGRIGEDSAGAGDGEEDAVL